MKRERELVGNVAAPRAEDAGKKKATPEEKMTELSHFSHGDGSGGFRTSALLSDDEIVKNVHDEEKSDDDGEDHGNAYIAYVITDMRGKPSRCSLRPPAVQSQPPRGTTVMPTPTSRRKTTKGTMSLVHTYTPRRLRGRGLAERLCVEAFMWAAANQLRVDPECTYVSDTFLSRRPEFRAQVVRGCFDTQLSEEERKPNGSEIG